MRDNGFLGERLESIWKLLFGDVPKLNNVSIRFSGKSKSKFGHIARKGGDTEIVINELFRFDDVPEYIIDLTIAHELSHYAHGFNSPLKQKYRHPHKGGVVTKEMTLRGFDKMIKMEKMFFRKEWPKIYERLREFKK
ncbi:hypothetical protein J4425_01575 [Candidatus Woesearchaeota archaeon]|nr:hypothetical protein [Candidatus Woesearchaeota archaeon]